MQNPLVWTVYRSTLLVNGHIYVGVHKTRNPKDSYLGSGILLCAAIQEHGRSHFKKEIIDTHDNPDAAYAQEEEIVDRDFIARPDTFNIALGGRGRKHGRPGRDNSQWGTRWVWRAGEGPRKVPEQDLGQWLCGGWQPGRGPKYSARCSQLMEKLYQDPGVPRQGNPTMRGRVYVYRGGEEKRILPEDLNALLLGGWQKGRAKGSLYGRVCINRQGQVKMVPRNQLESWLSDGWRNGRKPSIKRKTSGNPRTKLDWNKVRAIRRRYGAGGISQTQLSREFGVSQGNIGMIVLNKTWRE